MWTAVEYMLVSLVVEVLQAVIKNPVALAKEKAIVSQLATLSTEADTLASGTVWSSTPGTPPPAA